MEIPKLLQWLNYGGTLKIVSKADGTVEACVGDAGGGGHVKTLQTSEEIFEWAEEIASSWIKSHEELLDCFKSGELEWPEEGFVAATGLKKIYKDDYNA